MHHTVTSGTNAAPHSHVVLNRVIPLILRSPFHWLLSRKLLLIGYTGRRSGTRYTIPVTYMERDGAFVIFSNQRWWKNLRGGAPVTLRVRGRTIDAIAEVDEYRPRVVREVQVFLDRNGVRAAPMINVQLGGVRQPTAALIAERTQQHVVVYVRPAGAHAQ